MHKSNAFSVAIATTNVAAEFITTLTPRLKKLIVGNNLINLELKPLHHRASSLNISANNTQIDHGASSH